MDELFFQHMLHIKHIQYKGHEITIIREESTKRYMADIRIDDYDGHTMQGFCGLETESEAITVAQAFVDGLHYIEEEE